MGQERQFGTPKAGNTADARRVLNTTTNVVVDKAKPPPTLGAAPNVGHSIQGFVNLAILTETETSAETATLEVWVWSVVSQKWHLWKELSITKTEHAFQLGVSTWDGIQLALSSKSGGNQFNAWIVSEHQHGAIGSTVPTL